MQNHKDILEFIIDGLDAGIWDVNLETNEEWWSPKLYQLLGYSQEEIFPSYDYLLNSLVHPDYREILTHTTEKNFAADTPFKLELPIQTKSEGYKWFEISAKLKRDSEDKPIHIVGSVINIDKRIKARQRYELFVDGIGAGIWEWNLITNELWRSKKYMELLSYTENEMEKIDPGQLVHPNDKHIADQALQNHFKTRKPYHLEVRLRTGKGEYRWFEASGKAQWDDNGKPLLMVGSIIDRNDSNQLRIQLEESEFFLKETGRITKVGGFLLNVTDGKIKWTKESYEIVEADSNFKPTLENIKMFFDKDGIEAMQNAHKNLLRKGKPFNFEHTLLTAKGNKLWANSTGIPVFNNEKKIVAIRGTIQDITSIKNKELELKQAYKLISDQNYRLKNFARITSHNLRSISANFTTALELYENATDAEEKKNILSIINKIAEGFHDTVNGLAEVSKQSSNKKQLKELLSFEDIFKHVLNTIQADILNNHAHIFYDFSACPAIEYIAAYLESFFLNFITNSIKYKHPEREPVITVKTLIQNDKKILTVSDNGLGIDLKKHGTDIFGMYKTFHDHPDAHGVGLFITKHQVEAEGGEIFVDSEINHGTTFKIIF